MIWLLIAYLANRDDSSSAPAGRPVPVLTRGASGRLWHVRELGGGLVELSNEQDQPVCTYIETSDERKLRSHPVGVKQADLDAALLDFKLRVGTRAA